MGALVAAMSMSAQTAKMWLDPEVNQENRKEARAAYFAYENTELAAQADKSKSADTCQYRHMWVIPQEFRTQVQW